MSTNWRKEAEAASAAVEFLAKRVAELVGERDLAIRLRDEAWESRNVIAAENQELIERLTRADA